MDQVSFTCSCGHQWSDIFPVETRNGEETTIITDDVCALCGRQCDPDDSEEENLSPKDPNLGLQPKFETLQSQSPQS